MGVGIDQIARDAHIILEKKKREKKKHKNMILPIHCHI